MFGTSFWPAVWIGLSIAAPVGPIGVLVIQRTLSGGRALGLATGWGAAVADAAYGALGAFGVATLIAWLQGVRVPLVLVGAAFLLWLAARTWRGADAVPAAATDTALSRSLLAAFAGSVLLTLSNPATILSFIAIFGSMAAQQGGGSPWVMVAGVLAGSALWWIGLVAAVGALGQRFDARARRWVGRTSALMLAAFAAWQVLGLRGLPVA